MRNGIKDEAGRIFRSAGLQRDRHQHSGRFGAAVSRLQQRRYAGTRFCRWNTSPRVRCFPARGLALLSTREQVGSAQAHRLHAVQRHSSASRERIHKHEPGNGSAALLRVPQPHCLLYLERYPSPEVARWALAWTCLRARRVFRGVPYLCPQGRFGRCRRPRSPERRVWNLDTGRPRWRRGGRLRARTDARQQLGAGQEHLTLRAASASFLMTSIGMQLIAKASISTADSVQRLCCRGCMSASHYTHRTARIDPHALHCAHRTARIDLHASHYTHRTMRIDLHASHCADRMTRIA